MNATRTIFSGINYALCSCCTDHGDARMEPLIVECIECGQPCSCEGCVAEQEFRDA